MYFSKQILKESKFASPGISSHRTYDIASYVRQVSEHGHYLFTYAASNQGDQMSLWKNRPKCSPTQF
jgi:hypothetical protein